MTVQRFWCVRVVRNGATALAERRFRELQYLRPHHRMSCPYPNCPQSAAVQYTTLRLRPITLGKQLHLHVFVKLHGVTYWGTQMFSKTAAITSNLATFSLFAVCPHFSVIPLKV